MCEEVILSNEELYGKLIHILKDGRWKIMKYFSSLYVHESTDHRINNYHNVYQKIQRGYHLNRIIEESLNKKN